MSNIHQTAIVHESAKLHKTVEVGPYCIIHENVEIGENTKLASNVIIENYTKIGKDNKFYPFCVIGGIPQDKKYSNEKTNLIIGDRNQIREYVTINKGTELGGGLTKIGNECLIMATCHIAHDCIIGDKVTISNGTSLAGHIVVENKVIIGGMSGIHQFCRIGTGSMIGGMSAVVNHVLPFTLHKGHRNEVSNINIVGLKRMGYSIQKVREIKMMIKNILSNDFSLSEKIEKLKLDFPDSPEKKAIIDFINFANKKIPIPKNMEN